jgi:hypothetical protein
MRSLHVDTPHGQVAFLYEGWSEKPLAVLFHGFGQTAEHLYPWAARLPDHNLVFACLPGHAGAPQLDGGLREHIAAFRSAVSAFPTPPDLIIGESLGSLIAITIKARLAVAIDPFLSTAKLWPLHVLMRQGGHGTDRLRDLYKILFDDRDYRFVLRLIVSRALVIGGSDPLMPPRDFLTSPSLLDDADFDEFASHPLVQAVRINGGHALLDDAPEECGRLIIAALGGSGSPQTSPHRD